MPTMLTEIWLGNGVVIPSCRVHEYAFMQYKAQAEWSAEEYRKAAELQRLASMPNPLRAHAD